MSRVLDDWITEYLRYTDNTESAAIFHKWTGISVIAAALRRKTWFNFGRIQVFPNMYIVFVSEPGIARKTQAISFGEEILTEISGITLAADTTTVQALLDDLEEAMTSHLMPNGENFTHASLTISSGEFESFLGDKRDNARMLVILTDLFDCKKKPFKTRTRHSGSNEIPNPYLNLIAATTPESLANSLPSTAIGGGLTSRIIFIWAEGKRRKVDVPEKPPSSIKDSLVKDLAVISRFQGVIISHRRAENGGGISMLSLTRETRDVFVKTPRSGAGTVESLFLSSSWRRSSQQVRLQICLLNRVVLTLHLHILKKQRGQ
jgi:hypothetical protein